MASSQLPSESEFVVSMPDGDLDEALPEGLSEATPGERLDLSLMRAEIAMAEANLAHRPRFANPCWYTGEAAFAVIGLLLPQSLPVDPQAVAARLRAIPDFLSDGQARLQAASAPRGWVERAKREAAVFAAFLGGDLRRHLDWTADWASLVGSIRRDSAWLAWRVITRTSSSTALSRSREPLLARRAADFRRAAPAPVRETPSESR